MSLEFFYLSAESYTRKFRISLSVSDTMAALQEGEVYVPGWGENKGMNDRFALLHPEAALQWRARLRHTLQHCRKEPIHSETFALRFADANDLVVRPFFGAVTPHVHRAMHALLGLTYTELTIRRLQKERTVGPLIIVAVPRYR